MWKIKLAKQPTIREHTTLRTSYSYIVVISHYGFTQNEYYAWIILRYFSTILCEEFPFVSSRISYVWYVGFLLQYCSRNNYTFRNRICKERKLSNLYFVSYR